jgi:hypothetical protein
MEQSRPRSSSQLKSSQPQSVGAQPASGNGSPDVFDAALAGTDDHLWKIAVEPGGIRRSPWVWALGGAGSMFLGLVVTLAILVGPTRIATMFGNGTEAHRRSPVAGAANTTEGAVRNSTAVAERQNLAPVATPLPAAETPVPAGKMVAAVDGDSAATLKHSNKKKLSQRKKARRRRRVGQTRWWERKRAAEASRAKAAKAAKVASHRSKSEIQPKSAPPVVATKADFVAAKPAVAKHESGAKKQKTASGKPQKHAKVQKTIPAEKSPPKAEPPKRAEKAHASQWQDPYD